MDIENIEEKTVPFEIKALTEKGAFTGYAAIFGKPDALNEIIERGAFIKTLKENRQYPILWYHTPQDPIGAAEVEEDEKGLKIIGQLNLDVQLAKEKYALMKQKVIRGLSFGFKTVKDKMEGSIRKLIELNLYEISLVTFGAHPDALISAIKQRDKKKSKISIFSPVIEKLGTENILQPRPFESTIKILKGQG